MRSWSTGVVWRNALKRSRNYYRKLRSKSLAQIPPYVPVTRVLVASDRKKEKNGNPRLEFSAAGNPVRLRSRTRKTRARTKVACRVDSLPRALVWSANSWPNLRTNAVFGRGHFRCCKEIAWLGANKINTLYNHVCSVPGSVFGAANVRKKHLTSCVNQSSVSFDFIMVCTSFCSHLSPL